MREFEIQEGQLRLRRSIDLREYTRQREGRGEQMWFLEIAVVGLAGAVSLGVEFGHHRPTQAWVLDADHSQVVTFAPSGVFVHAYRPIPDRPDAEEHQRPETCKLLHGGRCYSLNRDGPSLLESSKLTELMTVPGGVADVWLRLEAVYREEFGPALHPSAIAQAERERGAEIAEARAEGHAAALERKGMWDRAPSALQRGGGE